MKSCHSLLTQSQSQSPHPELPRANGLNKNVLKKILANFITKLKKQRIHIYVYNMCTIITYLQFQNLIIGKKKSSDFYLFSLILRELISVWLEIIITGIWFSVTARNVYIIFIRFGNRKFICFPKILM